MSTNTTIQEGGMGYSFGPVKCLMVEGDNGEFYPWYPEADRALDSLSVTQNGIYRASDRGVYGWNHVSVNVSQSDRVTGRDPETGEEKTVTVDPETGELVETVVPVEIRITTLPTKTQYTNGETIVYSGIVVHAYSSTGQEMGEVPFGELVFPVTTAQGGDAWSDGQGLNATMLYYTPHWLQMENTATGETSERQVFVGVAIGNYGGRPAAYGSAAGPATMLATRYRGRNYMLRVSSAGGQNQDLFAYCDGEISGGIKYTGWDTFGSSTGIPASNKFESASWSEYLTSLPESTVDPTTVDPATLHATQSIPVQWQRPGDGAILETSFDITVTGGN